MFNSNNQNSTALVENNSFILPTPMDDSVSATDLSEDMEGLRLTFPKVKIPGGGVLQFEMLSDDPECSNYRHCLEMEVIQRCKSSKNTSNESTL